jgi:hypothetical protein
LLLLCLGRGERLGKLAAAFADGTDDPTFSIAARALGASAKIKKFASNANFAIDFCLAGALRERSVRSNICCCHQILYGSWDTYDS